MYQTVGLVKNFSRGSKSHCNVPSACMFVKTFLMFTRSDQLLRAELVKLVLMSVRPSVHKMFFCDLNKFGV